MEIRTYGTEGIVQIVSVTGEQNTNMAKVLSRNTLTKRMVHGLS